MISLSSYFDYRNFDHYNFSFRKVFLFILFFIPQIRKNPMEYPNFLWIDTNIDNISLPLAELLNEDNILT